MALHFVQKQKYMYFIYLPSIRKEVKEVSKNVYICIYVYKRRDTCNMNEQKRERALNNLDSYQHVRHVES